jgi:stage II sporulation protein D
MKKLLLPLSLFALSCATATPPASQPPVTRSGGDRPVSGRLETATVTRPIQEPSVRVGLHSDETVSSFPRIDGGYVLVSDAGTFRMDRGFRAEAPVGEASLRWAVQVAALSDRESAEKFAEQIRSATGERVDLLLSEGGGLYRVLAGSVATENEARPLREKLTAGGFGKDMLIVRRPADQQVRRTIRITDDEGAAYTLEAGSLLILPATAETVTIAGERYRGGARLFVNDRGLFNVINELNLEDYVRGVVPNEMGPRIFDEVEALKVQALAARTYVIQRRGDFAREGYDICPTPACQVYRGFSTEDALSDQAVRETAGLVIVHKGKTIDALYTSTCGGETSDVGVMFPGRNEPYLRRARCVEMEMFDIAGRATSAGNLTEMQTNAAILAAAAGIPAGSSWAAADVARSVAAASALGGPRVDSAVRPASSRRGDVLAYLGRVWDIESAARKLTLPEDRRYFFPRAADDPSHLAAAFLIKYGVHPAQYLDPGSLSEAMPRDEMHALLFSWLREHETLLETSGKVFRISGRELTLKAAGKTTAFTLPPGIPIYRRLGDRFRELSTVPVMIGDRAAVIHRQRGQPVAVIIQANYDGASFDRTSNFANWTRSYRADDLAGFIAKRTAIKSLRDLKILGTDLSQRVTALEVHADESRTFTLRGLPIRWSLNLPDNLFVFNKTRDADGMDRYTFFGKGWGHGTGMCQVGAYGMAFRGHTAADIVRHYYTGVEIVPFTSIASR